MKVVVLLAMAGVASASPHHGVTKIQIDYEHTSFQDTEWHATITWNGTAFVADKRVIDPKLIDLLYTSLGNTKPDTDPRTCNSHTDDYPDFKIAIDGDEPLRLESTSNCHAHVPWNITKGAGLGVQFTGEAWTGLSQLLAAVDGNQWKAATTPIPIYVGEQVSFGTYASDTPAKSGVVPARCAKAFEAHPQVRELFGAITIDHVEAFCVMSESKDCSSLLAQVTWDWGNVQNEETFPCVAGAITVPPTIVTEAQELRPWLATKVMRTLLGTSIQNPIQFGDRYALTLRDRDFDVFWKPKTEVVELVSQNTPAAQSVWKQLGLDPKALLVKEDGLDVIKAVVNFNGKLVKR
ncbi:MAG: hypothetical protein QM831_24710 [Kofleriaceae bacterium]